MPLTVTIEYRIKPTGSKSLVDITAAIDKALVPAPSWVPGITGAVYNPLNDTTGDVGGEAYRRIVYAVNTATFARRFPNNPTSPFMGIMTGILRAAVDQPVRELAPVVV